MSRRGVSALVVLALIALLGCSSAQGGADMAMDRASNAPSPSLEPRASRGTEWACSPGQVFGFATDPVVYPAELSLPEVLSELDGETYDIVGSTAMSAVVRFRDERGLIVRRLDLERTETVGWHVERGRSCQLS